jgi:putative endonuclease
MCGDDRKEDVHSRNDKLRLSAYLLQVGNLEMTFELKTYFIYILASKPRGVLYIGFTSDLVVRVVQHRLEEFDGFTKRYFIKRLVYYESFADPSMGITREKQLKKWNREWKIKLIEKHNPEWLDLYQHGEILPLPNERQD